MAVAAVRSVPSLIECNGPGFEPRTLRCSLRSLHKYVYCVLFICADVWLFCLVETKSNHGKRNAKTYQHEYKRYDYDDDRFEFPVCYYPCSAVVRVCVVLV